MGTRRGWLIFFSTRDEKINLSNFSAFYSHLFEGNQRKQNSRDQRVIIDETKMKRKIATVLDFSVELYKSCISRQLKFVIN